MSRPGRPKVYGRKAVLTTIRPECIRALQERFPGRAIGSIARELVEALADRLQSGQLPGQLPGHVSNGEFDPDTKPLVL